MIKLFLGNITKSKDNILKGGLVLFLGMNLVSFANYIFNVTMGRMLGPIEYGGFVSIMSLLAIVGVPANTIQTAAAKFSAVFLAENSLEKIKYLIKYLTKKIAILSLIVFIFLLLLSQPIANFLKLGSNVPIIIFSFVALIIFLVPINRGVIQGMQNFKGLSINLGFEPILKILFGGILVAIGYKLNGAVLAILIANILVYIFGFFSLKKIFANKEKSFPTKDFWHYSLPVLVGIFLLNFLTYGDVILAKHYLSLEEAGLYSGVSTIAKIVIYFGAPFIATMFPKISDLYTRKQKHYPLLMQTIAVVFILSALITAFFMMFPAFTIKLLFGNNFISASNYLGNLSLAMLLLSLSTIFVNYYMAIGKKIYMAFLSFFSVILIVLMNSYHYGIGQIINNLLISFGGLLLSLTLYYVYTKKEKIIYAINNYSRLQ
jgi:O-antigen/teichoic acid export membrane protein